jgi:hypothetical protein
MPLYIGVAKLECLDQTKELLDEVQLFEHNRKRQGPTYS